MNVNKNQLLVAMLCAFLIVLAMLVCARWNRAEATQEPSAPEQVVCVVKFTPETATEPAPAPTPAPLLEPTPTPEPSYTEEELLYLTNMIYSEIGAICYDKSYTTKQQDLALQQWGRVPLNQIARGTAGNLYDLFNMRTYPGSPYYIWNPLFTRDYEAYKARMTRNRGGFDDGIYERCKAAAIVALEDKLETPLPGNVIYADLSRHGGGVYQTYPINTGYYRSVVHLCYA